MAFDQESEHGEDDESRGGPLKRITIRGSIVGTRKDLAEAIQFAAEGKVKAHIHRRALGDVNEVLAGLNQGTVDGRIVLDIAA